MTRTVLASCLCLAAAPALAQEHVLTLGTSDEGSAMLAFGAAMTAADAFTLRTEGIAVPGTRLRVSVDDVPYDLVDHVLAPEDCVFEGTAATCEVAIEGGSRAYSDLVATFKAGLDAHLDVTNAGHSVMRESVSLDGFTDAFDAL